MVKWVQRDEWDARSPRGTLANMPAAHNVKGTKVHYTGGVENTAMGFADGHHLCDNRVRSVQNGHMDGNGWSDIGYSFLVCPHGYAFVGRGFGKLPAANGPGLNSGHYAVLGMVGDSGLVTPSAAMLNGIRDVIEWLRAKGVGDQIRGHRDGYATSCPGDKLYAWVKDGAPRPKGSPTPPPPKPVEPKPAPTEDEDMTVYTALGWTGPAPVTSIPPSTITDVTWDKEWADPTKDHVDAGGPSFLDGPARFTMNAELVLSGLTTGDVVETRLVEVKAGTSPGEVLESTQWRSHLVASSGQGTGFVIAHGDLGAVQEGRKLRLQLRHNGASSIVVTKGWLRMTSQES